MNKNNNFRIINKFPYLGVLMEGIESPFIFSFICLRVWVRENLMGSTVKGNNTHSYSFSQNFKFSFSQNWEKLELMKLELMIFLLELQKYSYIFNP